MKINNFLINKEKNRKNNLSLALLIMFIVFISLIINISDVSAIGITPGRTTINYDKGLEKEVEFSVVNNEHKNMQVFLTVQGELNQSVSLSNSLVEFLPSEESKSFKYKIKLTDEMGKSPGLHTADVVALEVPKSGSGNYVGAAVAVVSQIYVYVSCPGKCIDADLTILDTEENGTATFIIPVVSRGKLGIGQVRATIDIYTSLNQKVASIETDSQELPPDSRIELSSKWNVNVPAGDYLAKVTIFYDGESKNLEKVFSVGVQSLEIQSIMVNNFHLGEIAKLQILVENKWSQEIKGIFANLLVYNHDDQVMADIKSAPEDIASLSKKELIAYWDTVGVSVGQYNGKLMVKYGQKSTDKQLVLKVSENNLDVLGVGYTIKPQGTSQGVNIIFILIVLVVILLILNLAWFIFFRRIISMNKSSTEKTSLQKKRI